MCWFKKKEGKYMQAPMKGIVVFAWDSAFYQVFNCKPRAIRYITNKGYDFQGSVGQINWLLSHNVKVMVNVDCIPLAESLSSIFGGKISLQYRNEINGGPDGYVSPEDYMAQFKQFERIVRSKGSGCVMSGLNCEDKNVKKYFKQLIPLGIKEATDRYVLHTYTNTTNYNDMVSYMRKTAPDKPIDAGEFGKNTHIEDIKISAINKFIARFSIDNINTMYLYAWENGDNWGISSQTKTIIHYANI